MKRRMIRATVVMAILIVGVMVVSGLMGATNASAHDSDSDDLEFAYLLPRPLDNLLCDQAAAALVGSGVGSFARCPDMATASNGETIEMTGSGTLRIKAEGGRPKKVEGGGEFVHTTGGGPVSGSGGGTWEAKELLMFETFGPGDAAFIAGDPEVGEAWRTGRALILVKLKYDSGMKVNAILEIGCRLPGNGGIPGTIEGIRLLISGGLNFNVAADPRSTLFIHITDQEEEGD